MNKAYGTTILASDTVVKLCEKHIRFRKLGSAQAKGRVVALEIYEVMGDNKITEYQVKMADKSQSYKSLGEAYIEAGEMAGTKT